MNKEFSVFSGLDHKKERLYIHWDITAKCNFDCSYCYAKKQYQDEWGNESNKSIPTVVSTAISRSTLPVFVGLLGGEPTQSKYYFDILNKINNNILFNHKDNRLYITTNLSKNLDFWKNHPKIKRTFILASFHPDYFKDNNEIDIFVTKLKYLKTFFKIKVNVMLIPKYLDSTLYLLKELKELNILIHPQFLYTDGSPFKDITKTYTKEEIELYKDIYKNNNIQNYYQLDGKELNDYDIFSQEINQFKNWQCFQNNYEINYKGEVHQMCTTKPRLSILKNINFFKRITKINSIPCEHNFCNCDGLLNCEKIKKEI